jgi:hypothetical protein
MSHGDPTGVYGDACIARNGKISRSGGQIIAGDLYYETPADIKSALGYIQGTIFPDSDFYDGGYGKIPTAQNLAAAIRAKPCSQSLPKTPSSVTVVSGENVLCFPGGAEFTKDLCITGPADATVYVNVYGGLKVNGAKVTTCGGVAPSDIVWNVNSGDTAFSGGGGGLGCCKAGTFSDFL